MSNEKNLKVRISNKHDIEANWLKATNFIPKAGELIIYDPDENFAYARFKFGDGVTLINDLPFGHLQSDFNQTDETQLDFIKNKPDTITPDMILQMLDETGAAQPIADIDNSVLTTEDNKIVIL